MHPTTLFRTFAPAIERKLLLHQMSVLIDVRRQTSITTQRRARNGASGELKYQPSKHTQSMINYSITMRSVNSNLLEINQAKSRINQAKREGKNHRPGRPQPCEDRGRMAHLRHAV